jgi:hypothetical protein
MPTFVRTIPAKNPFESNENNNGKGEEVTTVAAPAPAPASNPFNEF